jgi:hypothetical protein
MGGLLEESTGKEGERGEGKRGEGERGITLRESASG